MSKKTDKKFCDFRTNDPEGIKKPCRCRNWAKFEREDGKKHYCLTHFIRCNHSEKNSKLKWYFVEFDHISGTFIRKKEWNPEYQFKQGLNK